MRNQFLAVAAFCGLVSPGMPVSAQSPADEVAISTPVTVESYYKIRWGADLEFFALYQKNHLPILEEAKARGIVKDIRVDVPFTHMAGGTRWDLRVTITYRDADAALVADPELAAVFDEVVNRLKAGNDKFDAEEARRFGLLEEHWDVVLVPQS